MSGHWKKPSSILQHSSTEYAPAAWPTTTVVLGTITIAIAITPTINSGRKLFHGFNFVQPVPALLVGVVLQVKWTWRRMVMLGFMWIQQLRASAS